MYSRTVLFVEGPKSGEVRKVCHPQIECYTKRYNKEPKKFIYYVIKVFFYDHTYFHAAIPQDKNIPELYFNSICWAHFKRNFNVLSKSEIEKLGIINYPQGLFDQIKNSNSSDYKEITNNDFKDVIEKIFYNNL